MPASSKEFFDIQATIKCGFTLKRVRDMTRTYIQCKIHSGIAILSPQVALKLKLGLKIKL